MKYLADKIGSPAYPKDLKRRARVDERMDWTSTQLCSDLVYELVYPQIFKSTQAPQRRSAERPPQSGGERAQTWLKVLFDHPRRHQQLPVRRCDAIADYHAASYVALAEVIGSDLAAYPNVKRWLGRMKTSKSWPQVYQVIDGFAASLGGQGAMVSV